MDFGLNLSVSLKSTSLATFMTLEVHISGALWYQIPARSSTPYVKRTS